MILLYCQIYISSVNIKEQWTNSTYDLFQKYKQHILYWFRDVYRGNNKVRGFFNTLNLKG